MFLDAPEKEARKRLRNRRRSLNPQELTDNNAGEEDDDNAQVAEEMQKLERKKSKNGTILLVYMCVCLDINQLVDM